MTQAYTVKMMAVCKMSAGSYCSRKGDANKAGGGSLHEADTRHHLQTNCLQAQKGQKVPRLRLYRIF